MKKIFKRKSPAVEAFVQPDLAVAIDKIQQQLTFLEKKLDVLIAQSSEARPFQRPDNSFRRDRGGRENSFRERSFTKAICAECNTECEVPFKPTGDRPVYCKECFSKRKDGVGSSSVGRNFDKSQGRGDRGFGGRKKPAFRKRSRERA